MNKNMLTNKDTSKKKKTMQGMVPIERTCRIHVHCRWLLASTQNKSKHLFTLPSSQMIYKRQIRQGGATGCYLIRTVDGIVDREIEDRPGVDRSTDGLEDHRRRGDVPALERLSHYRPVLLNRLRCAFVFCFAIVFLDLAPQVALLHFYLLSLAGGRRIGGRKFESEC